MVVRGWTCGLDDTASTDNVVPAMSQTLARRTAPPVFSLVACVPLGLRFPHVPDFAQLGTLLHLLLRFDELDVFFVVHVFHFVSRLGGPFLRGASSV